MHTTTSYVRVSCFRHRVFVWTLLIVFLCSFMPFSSIAQQPTTATLKTLSGNVLVSDQVATTGTVLQTGDTIQTQAGASAVLELSDGSEIQLGEKTQIDIDDLSQTTTGARVSSIKLLAGRLRALLSPGHQLEGSAFTIETPNAQLGVTFSQPDVEVSYDPAKAETIGRAHTVALMAKNLLTDEEMLVPVGSSVIIVGTTVKIVAGALTIAGATEAGTTAAGATEAATGTGATSVGSSSSAGSSGMGTGTKVAIGAGVAAAVGGVVAIAVSSGGESNSNNETDNNETLSGQWKFSGSGLLQGCPNEGWCGGIPCFPFHLDTGSFGTESAFVNQTGNTLSGFWSGSGSVFSFNGIVNDQSISFTMQGDRSDWPSTCTTNYEGSINGGTIRGSFYGSGRFLGNPSIEGFPEPFTVTYDGTFTVNIQK